MFDLLKKQKFFPVAIVTIIGKNNRQITRSLFSERSEKGCVTDVGSKKIYLVSNVNIFTFLEVLFAFQT